MVYPTLKEFKRLAKKGNVIPVYREILADLETPVSAFLKLKDGSYSYLLESVESQENIGRYSFLASKPKLVFEAKGNQITFLKYSNGRITKKKCLSSGTPLDEIKKMLKGFKFVTVEGLPRFCGGLVGYMGYDAVRYCENIPDKNADDLKLPDCVFMLSDSLLIFDHVNRKIKIVSNVILNSKTQSDLRRSYKESVEKIDRLIKQLKAPLKKEPEPKTLKGAVKITSNLSKSQFKQSVRDAKKYISKGDIIQVVLSQRFKTKLRSNPIDIYRSLRSINPSPFMFYMKLSGMTLIGSSPELLVRCQDGMVETRPIAGTRPRGKSLAEDERFEKELLSDKKECAEHLMLVDLGRNDLGRVCDFGTVKVTDFMSVERYSHVMHIVSNVTGRLSKNKDAMDTLISCFPAGTLSGAPKIRAMEIIDELEHTKRGPYGGALGYFSFSGNLDTCIIIRTMIIKDGYLYIQAGCGIVSDSNPEKEYYETVNKAKALFEAVRGAY